MGSAQCCSMVTEEQKSEIVIASGETQQSSKKQEKNIEDKKSKKQALQPIEKQKGVNHSHKQDDPLTPAFAEIQSHNSKNESEYQSNKDIQLVAEIVMQLDEIAKQNKDVIDDQLISQSSMKRKKQNDSPVCEFQQKNSLKQFSQKNLNKLKSLSEHRLLNDEENNNDLQSQRSQSIDNKSVKSILKQEMKFSQFRKPQKQTDLQSQKKVHFSGNK